MSQELDAEGCPIVDQEEFDPWVQYTGLMIFSFYTVFMVITIFWWYCRKNHVWLRKRNFGLMVLNAIGIEFAVIAIALRNYLGRASFPCRIHLFLMYLMVALGGAPLVARLVLTYNTARFNRVILEEADDGSLDGNYEATANVFQEIKIIFQYIFCGTCFRRLDVKKNSNVSPKLYLDDKTGPVGSFRQTRDGDFEVDMGSEAPRRKRNLSVIQALHITQKAIFGYIVLGFFVVVAFIAIGINFLKPDNPYVNDCNGCLLQFGDIFLIGSLILLIILLGSYMLYLVKDESDPLETVSELRTLLLVASLVVLSTVLAVIDIGKYRKKGVFDWLYLAAIAAVALHSIQCPYQIHKSYKLDARRRYKRRETTMYLDSQKEIRAPAPPDLLELLQTDAGKRSFEIYLVTEYSVENLFFLYRIWRFKAEYDDTSPQLLSSRANEIYKRYLIEGSLLEVNISGAARKDITKVLGNPTLDCPPKNLFDNAGEEIFKLLETDSFPRYLKSKYYKEYIGEAMSTA